ncbi:MAG: recombinase family protein, partial [Candidatus Omnitrophica bacterium]|nr:recombinase family protein [Candidatus Omnitrophota bacterium]
TRNVIGAFSQFDNDQRSERTKSGMKQALQNGRWCFQAPIGYKFSRDNLSKPILIPSEDAVFAKEAFALFATGLHTQVAISNMLKAKGAKKMSRANLNRMLRQSLYAGIIRVKRWFTDDINGIHEALISKETFLKVQMILTGKRPIIAPKSRSNPAFPLRPFVRCSKCGQKLTGGYSTGRKKVKYGYYHCRTKDCHLNVKKAVLETKFYEYLKTFEVKAEVWELFEKILFDVWKTKQQARIDEQLRIEHDIQKLKETKDRIDELMIKGVFDADTYKKKAEEVKNDIVVKQVELNEVNIELNDIEACLSYAKAVLLNIANLWANAEHTLKQRFQTLVFPQGVSFDGEEFRTAVTSMIIKQLQQIPARESQLVALSGFEPES